ncbi:MAG TPA: undecaprenyl-diphosphate phosphatase [Deltaproteobacteria bacterium]|nr:undecaprenyl-diphosphate phosphatase [Deltaproteobacteria bacterium]
MPDSLVALLLGIIQGITEFLPVSSSGHLTLSQDLFGETWRGDVLFNLCVHAGTTLAVIVFFHRDLFALIRGIMPGTFRKDQAGIILCIMVTTAITGIIGLTFKDWFESLFSMPLVASWMLILTGVITFATDRVKQSSLPYGQVRFRDAAVIGVFQAFAIIPGISRSGSTIFAGVLCGLERKWAASYSFIAAIPAILGATVLEFHDNAEALSLDHLLAGGIACIVGLISLKFLIWTLQRHSFFIFSVYCWTIGFMYISYSIMTGT